MSDIESLEQMVQKPKKVRKPNNAALWFAYAFFNVVILAFDIIAAGTVYAITHNWAYTILTFLSGFTPLILHEALYLRAYASQNQRWISIGGAILAVGTVALVALLSAGVNIALANGANIPSMASEYAIIFLIVGSALLHGVLTAVYFYIDEGIRATHTEAENIAWFDQRMRNIDRAERMMEKANRARFQKSRIANKFGGQDGKAALERLLSMLNDDDGDGIPNFMDKVDNRKQQFAADTDKVQSEKRDGNPNPQQGKQ